MPAALTTGEVAMRLGVRTWQVRRLYERGILPPASRVGSYRVAAEGDLPRIADALRQAGYIKQGAACS